MTRWLSIVAALSLASCVQVKTVDYAVGDVQRGFCRAIDARTNHMPWNQAHRVTVCRDMDGVWRYFPEAGTDLSGFEGITGSVSAINPLAPGAK